MPPVAMQTMGEVSTAAQIPCPPAPLWPMFITVVSDRVGRWVTQSRVAYTAGRHAQNDGWHVRAPAYRGRPLYWCSHVTTSRRLRRLRT